MTSEYAHQWPLVTVQAGFESTLQWNHSIVDENDFKSTWTARENAAALAFSLGTPFCSSPPVLLRERSCPRSRHVGFLDEVQVYLGEATSLKMRSFCTTVAGLRDWVDKPWAKRLSARVSRLQKSLVVGDFIIDSDRVPLLQCKVIDNHGRPDGLPTDGSGPGFPARPDDPPDLPRVPDFTDNIIDAVGRNQIAAHLPPEGFVELRTWFVQHEHPRRHFPARRVTLHGPQATWMDQVRAAWTDDLDLDAPIGYQICQPQPPRGPEEVDISLDIILSQGLHLWRYSGLVTVSFLDDLEGNTRFHVASSFLREVSGYDVVDAVDLHHLCSPIAPRRCSITHGWTPIPVTPDRLHRMRSGHAFVILVPAGAALDPRRAIPQTVQAADEEQTFAGIPMDDDPSSESNDPPEGEEEEDAGDDDPPLHDHGTSANGDDELTLFNCHIYRLHHQPLHLFLRRVQGVPLLCELARVLHQPREVFVASYPVWVRMVGQHFDNWSIIVQHVDDIPAASADCLVILDVEVHFPVIIGALPALPATTRRVLRVHPYT